MTKLKAYVAELSHPNMPRHKFDEVIISSNSPKQAQQDALNIAHERSKKDGEKWGVVRVY